MEALKPFEQLFEDVAYLKEQNMILSRKLDLVLTMLPNEVKGHKAAGEMVGVSEHTMLELAKSGQVPYKKHGRRVSYSMKDLIEYKMTRELGTVDAAGLNAGISKL